MTRRSLILALALSGPVAAGAIGGWLAYRADALWPEPAIDPASLRVEPMARQIVVDPTRPAWLRYAGGGPYFLCGPGDPEGFLYRGTLRADGTRDGDQMALIHKLAGTGANSIYLMAVRSHGGDGDETQNPFVDHDPTRELNPALLDQWERWFTAMDDAGITIFFFLYDDSARIWDTGDRVSGAERAFVRALVNRFKHHKYLIWVIAEEYEEVYSPRRASRLAAEIRAADEHAHPIAVHKLNGLDFTEFADDPFIDQFAIQFDASGPEALHDGIVRAWRAARGRYNLNLAETHPTGGRALTRKRNWAVALGGAYSMVLGMDIASTAVADLEDCGRLARFMEATDFQRMAPHDELAAADTQYVLAKPGESYIAYASDRSANIGLRDMTAGAYDLTWFDPVTGATVELRRI
ncbi:MAG: hypothetical protein ACE5DS_08825, partial [Kiloniellaceae bacterium]